jgi:L-rhamnose isomerase
MMMIFVDLEQCYIKIIQNVRLQKDTNSAIWYHLLVADNTVPSADANIRDIWVLCKTVRSESTNVYKFSRSRVRFPALPDFLRSSVCGSGSTQPREDN